MSGFDFSDQEPSGWGMGGMRARGQRVWDGLREVWGTYWSVWFVAGRSWWRGVTLSEGGVSVFVHGWGERKTRWRNTPTHASVHCPPLSRIPAFCIPPSHPHAPTPPLILAVSLLLPLLTFLRSMHALHRFAFAPLLRTHIMSA